MHVGAHRDIDCTCNTCLNTQSTRDQQENRMNRNEACGNWAIIERELDRNRVEMGKDSADSNENTDRRVSKGRLREQEWRVGQQAGLFHQRQCFQTRQCERVRAGVCLPASSTLDTQALEHYKYSCQQQQLGSDR